MLIERGKLFYPFRPSRVKIKTLRVPEREKGQEPDRYVSRWIVVRNLDHFHRFQELLDIKDLGWSAQVKPLSATINIFPDDARSDEIWKKAVLRAIEEKAEGLGVSLAQKPQIT